MSKKSPAKPEDIDPAAEYSVRLIKPIKVGPMRIRPGVERVRLKGSVLIANREAVAVFELVEPR